jgi:hypothetical protein
MYISQVFCYGDILVWTKFGLSTLSTTLSVSKIRIASRHAGWWFLLPSLPFPPLHASDLPIARGYKGRGSSGCILRPVIFRKKACRLCFRRAGQCVIFWLSQTFNSADAESRVCHLAAPFKRLQACACVCLCCVKASHTRRPNEIQRVVYSLRLSLSFRLKLDFDILCAISHSLLIQPMCFLPSTSQRNGLYTYLSKPFFISQL